MESNPAVSGHAGGNLVGEVKRRNRILFYFGLFNFIGALVCLLLMLVDERQVAGINAWIKPFKFYISIAVFCWTISWYLVYLDRKKAVKVYNGFVVVTMLIEMIIITLQAARGVKSHFNVSTPMDGILFSVMGFSIGLFTLATLYIFILFCVQKRFPVHAGYYWGIRIGLLLFIVFAIEGGLMASMLRHTVGAEDGGAGLPLLNWSNTYGDLRIAHFFGMHALQVIPFAGYFFFKSRNSVLFFGVVYFLLVVYLLWRAMTGLPLGFN